MIKCPDNFIYSFLKLGRQIAQQMTKTRMIKREYAGSKKNVRLWEVCQYINWYYYGMGHLFKCFKNMHMSKAKIVSICKLG